VSPVKYELGFYIPEDGILLCKLSTLLFCGTLSGLALNATVPYICNLSVMVTQTVTGLCTTL
jgi:hypothetical protein